MIQTILRDTLAKLDVEIASATLSRPDREMIDTLVEHMTAVSNVIEHPGAPLHHRVAYIPEVRDV